jgi:hypothetical protein
LATGMTTPNALVFPAGGNVDVTSFNSTISIGSGGINTGVLNNTNATLSIATGAGGSVSLNAPSFITVAGNVITKGGDTKGSGTTGSGGIFSASTSNNNPDSDYVGGIKITGYVDTRGGTPAVGLAGAGGDVTMNAGTIQVMGVSNGVSINTSAGSGAGSPGAVVINTFATQSIPTALDLTSKTAGIFAMPGGLFTIQTAAPVNGVAGRIVSGTNVASKATVGAGTGRLFAGNFTDGGINLTVTGGTITIPVVGGPAKVVTIADPTTGVRTKVTASQALALYEMSRNSSVINPTMLINPLGQTLTGSSVTVAQADLHQPFTAFKLLAIDAPTSGVSFNVTGTRPVITLPAKAMIGGTINFPSGFATSMVDFKGGAMNILAGGGITAPFSDLILSGTAGTWNNAGTISAINIIIARPTTSALTFNVNGPNAFVSANFGGKVILSPDVDLAMSVNFKSKNGNFNSGVRFGEVQVPSMYTQLFSTQALNATKLKPVNLTFALIDPSNNVQTPVISGQVSASTISISGLTQKVTNGGVASTVFTPISIGAAANLVANTTLKITSVAQISIGDFATLTAGVISSADSGSGTVAPTNILKAGSITILSTGVSGVAGTLGGVSIGNFTKMTSTGGNIAITSNLGDVSFVNANQLKANAGRIVVLAIGDVLGGQGNDFYARSTSAASSTAGGIEIGAGLKTSTALNAAFRLTAGTNPPANTLGAGINTTGTNTTGVIRALGTGTFNLSNGTASTFTLNHGAIVFDAVGGGNSVIFDNASFRTDAVKPIRQNSMEPTNEYIVDTELGD